MKKSILLDSNKYNVLVNFLDTPSSTSLLNLYLPIIGYKAVFIYEYLINVYKIDKLSSIKRDNLDDLLNTLGINIDEFAEVCSLLEATNLLQTYINKNTSDKYKLIFVLEKPLDYDSFMNNDNLRNLLDQNITSDNKNELRYIFNTNVISVNFENISEKTNSLFADEKIISNKVKDIDLLGKLSSEILIRCGKKVVLNNEIRKLVSDAFTKDMLPFEHIITFVINSLICTEDSICYVDENKLSNQINIYLSSCSSIQKNIIRNYKIFNLEENLKNYQEVINCYTDNNCENYLTSIIKNDISLETRNVFKFLKNKLNFCDAFINVLVDYCLIKNLGRIEPNYIYKIGNSINNIGLKTIEQVIKYLQFVSNNKKPDINKIFEHDDNTLSTNDLLDW